MSEQVESKVIVESLKKYFSSIGAFYSKGGISGVKLNLKDAQSLLELLQKK